MERTSELTDFLETHYMVANIVNKAYEKSLATNRLTRNIFDKKGLGGCWELSEDLTFEFQEKHKDNDWEEDDYFETLLDFIHSKLYKFN